MECHQTLGIAISDVLRGIASRTGLQHSENLRSEESEHSYERRETSSKVDPYAEKLATWLVIEATKSQKQRRTLRQIHTLSPKTKRSRTYPHREHLPLTKSLGQDSMENSDQTSVQFNNEAAGRLVAVSMCVSKVFEFQLGAFAQSLRSSFSN
jgi:hypothetical protein